MRALRRVDNGPLGVGATFEADEEIRMMGRTTKMTAASQIVAFDPPSGVSWTSMPSVPPKPKRIQWRFSLTPDGTRTRVVHECEVDFGTVASYLARGPYAVMRGGAIQRGMKQIRRPATADSHPTCNTLPTQSTPIATNRADEGR